jgi:hypothetical protein
MIVRLRCTKAVAAILSARALPAPTALNYFCSSNFGSHAVTDMSELRGIWRYRSFLNNPAAVGDFGRLAVWEAELSLDVADGG